MNGKWIRVAEYSVKLGKRRKCIRLKINHLSLNKIGKLEWFWLRLRSRVLIRLGFGVIYEYPEMNNSNAAEFVSQFTAVPFSGEVTDFKIWNRALSSDEVARHYNGEDIPD